MGANFAAVLAPEPVKKVHPKKSFDFDALDISCESRPDYYIQRGFPTWDEQEDFSEEYYYPSNILDLIKKNPEAWKYLGLRRSRYLGSGVHSLGFKVNNSTVVKLTRNNRDAWTAYLVHHNPQPHLVTIKSVHWVTKSRVWAIRSEFLDVKLLRQEAPDYDDGSSWQALLDKECRAARFWTDDMYEMARQVGKDKHGTFKCFDFSFSKFYEKPKLRNIPRI